MEYSDFYDIACYASENWKGNFTQKEIACYAYDYLCEFETSVVLGRPTMIINNLLINLKADDNDDTEYWYVTIKGGIEQ